MSEKVEFIDKQCKECSKIFTTSEKDREVCDECLLNKAKKSIYYKPKPSSEN